MGIGIGSMGGKSIGGGLFSLDLASNFDEELPGAPPVEDVDLEDFGFFVLVAGGKGR